MDMSISDLLTPLSRETFLREYYDLKPLHISGAPEKCQGVMSWKMLEDLLSMTSIWTSKSLLLVKNHQAIPPQDYCVPAVDRSQNQVFMPVAERVNAWLEAGATLVANDIDQLTPGVQAVARALEEAFLGKVQANLYCSSEKVPGFNSHFDTHDVFALHIAGHKTWRVYEGRHEEPLPHAKFRNFGQAHHDKVKGKVLMEVTLSPGDLLYIPRGQYHDALADSAGTIHVAFGLTPMIGMDLMTQLFNAALEDPLFRKRLPLGESLKFESHIKLLGKKISALCQDPGFVAAMKGAQRHFPLPRGRVEMKGRDV